ncbi:MAG: flagellar protein FlaG [Pigmentiphaga sp.]|nr:flagellar protein FlaG [Pigmentiphaga sp.]
MAQAGVTADATKVTAVVESQADYLQLDDDALAQALRELNQRLHAWSTNLRFEIDDETSRVVVQVVDSETGDVVRQIPSEEVLQMSKMLGKLQGLAFHASA